MREAGSVRLSNVACLVQGHRQERVALPPAAKRPPHRSLLWYAWRDWHVDYPCHTFSPAFRN